MTNCPKCGNNGIIRNGHPNNKKQQFFCKKCSVYFYEHEPNKLPSTKIPFQFIAKALYFRKLFKKSYKTEFPMRDFRKQINMSLAFHHVREEGKGVSRQTIHYWINKYGENFENIISKEEFDKYIHESRKKLYKHKNIDVKTIWRRKRTYKEALELTQWFFGGREKALESAKKNKERFEKIIEQYMYYELTVPEYE